MFQLINEQRKANGLEALVIDAEVQRVSYQTAGENIAGNSSNSAAVKAWMNSAGHKANILNGNFNYTGIGVVSGSKYGKIYVQLFVGR